MKLNLIKIASILMVLSMVFALAIPAFAEGEATSYNVTVKVGPNSEVYPTNGNNTLFILEEIKGAKVPFVDDAGREFIGWVDAEGNTVTAETVVTADMEVTAVYSYVAWISYNGHDEKVVLGENETLWPLATIKALPRTDDQDRVFQKWTCHGEEVDATTPVADLVDLMFENGGLVVTAEYSYEVTVHYNSGKEVTIPVGDNETLWILEGALKGFEHVDADGREFQGWYCNGKEVDYTTPVTGNVDVYAKYVANLHIGDKVVNKKMLDVKYQLNETETENTTDIRFVTSIDDLDYKSVSFKLTFTTPLDGTEVYTLTTNKAYTALAGEDKTPAQAFVPDSNYFVAYTITDMPTDFYKAITVQAILTLNDGTTVEGNVCPVAFN